MAATGDEYAMALENATSATSSDDDNDNVVGSVSGQERGPLFSFLSSYCLSWSPSPITDPHEESFSSIAPHPKQVQHEQRQHSKHDPTTTILQSLLLDRAPKEIACALTASFLVSPLVSIIDKCIVQDISGAPKFFQAMRLATQEMIVTPHVFLNSLAFRFTFGVYFGTYAVANLSEAVLEAAAETRQRQQRNNCGQDLQETFQKVTRSTSATAQQDAEERQSIKVVAASAANIALLAWRDSVFARHFNSGRGAGTTTTTTTTTGPPLRTLGLFAARDAATMYATFSLAPKAAAHLHQEHGMERNMACLSMALLLPVTMQIVTAPLHIHAMDYYQRRQQHLIIVGKSNTVSSSQSSSPSPWQVIRREFGTVAMARGLRILPAFGIGSFSNTKLREWFILNHSTSSNDNNKNISQPPEPNIPALMHVAHSQHRQQQYQPQQHQPPFWLYHHNNYYHQQHRPTSASSSYKETF
ncbi:hypothetical protein ACA910_018490 [Epithemia clementina (nom. ined.)]